VPPSSFGSGGAAAGMKATSSILISTVHAPCALTCHCRPTTWFSAVLIFENDAHGSVTTVGFAGSVLMAGRLVAAGKL
jgi:hypothetical protein